MVSAPRLPRTANPFDARLRAVHKAHQQEAVARIERMIAAICAVGAHYRERLMGILSTPRGVAEDAQRIRSVLAGAVPKLIDTLDDDDDVQTVWGNYEVSDAVMEKL